ncbi:helix-turn-helix domain-containing protein [Actinokineospora soli]|uniref:Helix-turn-helix domain-containing protein n=1 Tax=Actinokineospora soli TaxID=1048753 RepID=A0ABW2THK9_9PSEU
MARSPKSMALGSALRQARLTKELGLREFAEQIDRDPGMLSRWETGDRNPKPEHVAQILTALGVTGERYDDIMTLAYGSSDPQWVATTLPEQRQQMSAYVEFEQNATSIVEMAPLIIPGILQTNDTIRAIMNAGGVPPSEIAARVSMRIGRREVITGPRPAKLLALIGHGALCQDIGGTEVAIEQLRHLLEMASRPNVDLRVVPHRVGWHPGIEGPFALIESEESSSVFLGTRRSTLWLHQQNDVASYRRAVEIVLRVALTPERSMRHIAQLVQRMETRGDGSRLAKVES